LEKVCGVGRKDDEEDIVGREGMEEGWVIAADVPVRDEQCRRVLAAEAAALRLDCGNENVDDDVEEEIICYPTIWRAKVEDVGEVGLESGREKGCHAREKDDISKGLPVGAHEWQEGYVLGVWLPALDDRARALVDVHCDPQRLPFSERDHCLVCVVHKPQVDPRCTEGGAYELKPLAHRLLLDEASRRDGMWRAHMQPVALKEEVDPCARWRSGGRRPSVLNM